MNSEDRSINQTDVQTMANVLSQRFGLSFGEESKPVAYAPVRSEQTHTVELSMGEDSNNIVEPVENKPTPDIASQNGLIVDSGQTNNISDYQLSTAANIPTAEIDSEVMASSEINTSEIRRNFQPIFSLAISLMEEMDFDAVKKND